MSDEALDEVEDEGPGEGPKSIEASLERVDRWVKRFDRDMGGQAPASKSKEDRIAEAG